MKKPILVPKILIPHKFKCRPYQYDAWKAIKKGVKNVVCCWHRGCGKDLLFLNVLINMMVDRPAVYLHCFPNFSQGKRAIWNSNHQTDDGQCLDYLDHFPKELIKSKNSSEMMIKTHTGSIYCVMGVDGKNAQRARGMNPTVVIMSEYAFMDPQAWQTIEPRVSGNNGTAIFLSTPNGKNHFYDLYNAAVANPDKYFSSFLTVEHTKTVTPEHIQDLRDIHGMPEDFIQQEYYCSFNRGAEGSYYGKLVQAARDENRLLDIRLQPDLPVCTGWDIGIGDATGIWFFQQLRNGAINFLHYYENQGIGLEHYIKYLHDWKDKKQCIWGQHFVPHDMQNREFTSGLDRLTTARELGIDMKVIPKKSLFEGIQAVRSTLPNCFFDATECKRGIKCLDFYRKKYNDAMKVYFDEPCHDQWSHGADAFRMAAIGLRVFGTNNSSGLDDDMKALNRYWG